MCTITYLVLRLCLWRKWMLTFITLLLATSSLNYGVNSQRKCSLSSWRKIRFTRSKNLPALVSKILMKAQSCQWESLTRGIFICSYSGHTVNSPRKKSNPTLPRSIVMCFTKKNLWLYKSTSSARYQWLSWLSFHLISRWTTPSTLPKTQPRNLTLTRVKKFKIS